VHKGWWPNGKIQFEYRFANDEYEGEVKEWFSNGAPVRIFHYVAGHEAGSQKMWWEDGKIRANYVIINGEKFGLFGQKLCVNDVKN
jgi:antitoxin component YwqK of YwqJK toxin-antitoxin module